MKNQNQQSFIERIKKNLENNGFPKKSVSFDMETLYEAADQKNISLNDVLEELETKDKIIHRKSENKIIFTFDDNFEKEATLNEHSSNESDMAAIFNKLKDMDQSSLMSNPMEVMKKLSPKEIKILQNFYSSLSASEKEDIIKKGKEMGIS